MKKTFHFLSLFIAAGILLSSCSTQLSTVSIKKRHYRSGYYVDVASTKEKAATTKQDIKLSDEVTSDKTINPVTPGTIPATHVEPSIENDHTEKSADATASSRKYTPAQINKTRLKHINTSQEIKNIVERNNSIASAHTSKNDNGSLIWTIIAILLVLWLIALLTGGWGLGGLIYLILVIALVLLLLKLLGII